MTDRMLHRRDAISRRQFLEATGALGAAAALGSRWAAPALASSRPSTDIRIRDVRIEFEEYPFRTPLKFGGALMTTCVLLNARVRVERADGRSAEGFGSMPLGNIWSFPPRYVPPEQSLAAMKRLAGEIRDVTAACDDRAHPVDLARRLQPACLRKSEDVSRALNLARPIPKLCSLVVISPFDLAVHDAYGRVNDVNAYNALGREFVGHDLSDALDERFKGRYLDAYTLREPRDRMPLYHLVGALDPLTDADVKQRIGDGLPETLPEWIRRDELTHLKIKMNGDDLNWDVERVLAVDRVTGETQKRRGVSRWVYSVDFNERCPNVQYLLDLFARIGEKNSGALDRIQYVEQPTDRDLRAHPDNRMHAAAKIKPVVIDESLTDYESLLLAREQGYSGVALKACKGLTEALLMAAAALEFKLFLTVQDLTCPGASFLESAELSARVPTVAAIEGNARQYCPAANEKWAGKFPDVFTVTHGTVRTGALTAPGLGH